MGLYVLPVPRPDDSDTSSGNVLEPNMESTEIVSDDDENSIRLLGVFDLWQELGCEAERQRDLGRLVEVGLEDAPAISSQKRLTDMKEGPSYLLKMRKASKTCRSFLLGTVRRILSYSSGSESG